MDIKIEEISGKKKRSVKLFEDNKKWLITGATVLLIVVGFILCGSRKETELYPGYRGDVRTVLHDRVRDEPRRFDGRGRYQPVRRI